MFEIERDEKDSLFLGPEGDVFTVDGDRVFYLPPAILGKLDEYGRSVLVRRVADIQEQELYRGISLGRAGMQSDMRRLLNAAPLEPLS